MEEGAAPPRTDEENRLIAKPIFLNNAKERSENSPKMLKALLFVTVVAVAFGTTAPPSFHERTCMRFKFI